MKNFQATFDATCITLRAESIEEVKTILINEDDGMTYIERDGKLFVRWDTTYDEQVHITEIPQKKGIIAYESH